MKTIQFTTTNPEKNFTVSKNDINNSKALLPNVLYKKMERFVTAIILKNPDITTLNPKLYQLEILENAFLNDKLLIQSNIKKLNQSELQIAIVVLRKDAKLTPVICKAVFKFQLKETIKKAS
ncbi:hypothetical protein ACFQ5N_01570 [Lutibacter holmesii]|uniref:Uncharacterized protein n=1 Tax=Lutibacter holmesii TaxID=1137985 RepID=A0ABW3WMG2_9FLAO